MFLVNAFVRGEHLNSGFVKFGLRNRKHPSIVYHYDVYFDILNRSGVTHECDRQTGRRTDIMIANAALHYVVWPECCFVCIQYTLKIPTLSSPLVFIT